MIHALPGVRTFRLFMLALVMDLGIWYLPSTLLQIDTAWAALIGVCFTGLGVVLTGTATIITAVANARSTSVKLDNVATGQIHAAAATEQVHKLVNSNLSSVRQQLTGAVVVIAGLVLFSIWERRKMAEPPGWRNTPQGRNRYADDPNRLD